VLRRPVEPAREERTSYIPCSVRSSEETVNLFTSRNAGPPAFRVSVYRALRLRLIPMRGSRRARLIAKNASNTAANPNRPDLVAR